MSKQKIKSLSVVLNPLTVFMVAAECRGLAKIGGLADVVHDLSHSLTGMGVKVRIVLPYYEIIEKPAYYTSEFKVEFGKKEWPVQVYAHQLNPVPVYLLRNTYFFGGEYGKVYVDSNKLGRGPFEDDAKRFAFFSAAALQFIKLQHDLQPSDIIHCHDWHTGTLLLLLKYHPDYSHLCQTLKTLFTIHNLDYQGIRPFEIFSNNKHMSFRDWFPDLYTALRTRPILKKIRQLRVKKLLYNPIRTGINLADRINTVSPTYAREITHRDNRARNFIGGRGLEDDLKNRQKKKELVGILNGLQYEQYDPSTLDPPFDMQMKNWNKARQRHKIAFLKNFKKHIYDLEKRTGSKFKNSALIFSKLNYFDPKEWLNRPLVVAVTRVVGQKIGILLEKHGSRESLVQAILKRDVGLIIIGNGEAEEYLEDINLEPNAYFICAFDPAFANLLYINGDIFLMPSDFEPCGISQMIAMRYGCLPLVNNIGGLHDTVQHLKTGLKYGGRNRKEARANLLKTLDLALDYYKHRPLKWKKMQTESMRQRFEWTGSSRVYMQLYRNMLKKNRS